MTRMLLRDTMATLAPGFGLGVRAVEMVVARARLVRLGRGASLPTDGAAMLAVVLSGAVRLEWSDGQDATVSLDIVGPGRFVPLAGPDGAVGPRELRVRAHVESDLATLTASDVSEVLAMLAPEAQLAGMERVWRGLSRQLAECCALRSLSLAERVLVRLERLARQFGVADTAGVRVALPLTHGDLARLVAASRPNVTRAIGALERAGALRVRDGQYVVCAHRAAPPRLAESRIVSGEATLCDAPNTAPLAAAGG